MTVQEKAPTFPIPRLPCQSFLSLANPAGFLGLLSQILNLGRFLGAVSASQLEERDMLVMGKECGQNHSIEFAVGNPAAVILLSEWKDDEWLQGVAAGLNLFATAYVVRREKKRVTVGPQNGQKLDDSDTKGEPAIQEFDLRWFSPGEEVNLCGHATMASAHLLYESGVVSKKNTIYFHTKVGILSTRSIPAKESDAQENVSSDLKKSPGAAPDLVELNFPWITTTPSTVSRLEALTDTLSNVEVVAAGKASNNYLIVELESSEDVHKLKPRMQELLNCDSYGVVVTAPGGKGSGVDFVSRCFFPKAGVYEDPVCGTAHCVLGPYWSRKLEKNSLLAHQVSKRGGKIPLELDRKIGRVYIRGQSIIFKTGVFVE